jgi:hypothetical protein
MIITNHATLFVAMFEMIPPTNGYAPVMKGYPTETAIHDAKRPRCCEHNVGPVVGWHPAYGWRSHSRYARMPGLRHRTAW